MKRYYLSMLLSMIAMWATTTAMAQDKPHVKRLWWGINGGGAWQCSDVRTTGGGGLGTTLGIPLIENDHSLLGLELRGRYLWTATYGKDLKATIDPNDQYFPGVANYRNHRTSATNWDLELMLTANRLRAKTGMLLYVWGGVGAMGFKAKQNNYDEAISTQPYNYSSIGTSPVFNVKTELDFLRDWTYETRANQPRWPWWRFAPSAGIGIGYEFAPNFRMAAEWKVTFPQTDMLDSYVEANDNSLGYNKDIHHYVGLNLDFGLFGGGINHTTYTPPTDPNTYTPKGDGPAIVMVTPTGPHTDYNSGCAIEIRARLYNVRNINLITFSMNGVTVNPAQYSYDPTSGNFTALVTLGPGTNTFMIQARNQYGTAQQTFTAACTQPVIVPVDPVPVGNPPQVFVTYPTACPAIIANCRTAVHVTFYNVARKDEISVYHNGLQVSPQYYDYNPGTGELVMNVDLTPGDHRIEFRARTPFGQASASAMLRCPEQQAQLPTVTITTPGITPYSSPNCMQTVVAAVTGVQSKNDIQVYVDRALLPMSAWSYNPTSKTVTLTVSLTPGMQSTVEIIAMNAFGRAADIQMVSCYQQLPPPIVDVVSPPGGNYQGTDCNQLVTFQVFNVAGPQDITVLFGNQPVSPQFWTYNQMNNLLAIDVHLTPGIREQYTVIGVNSVGQDQATVSLQCSQPVEQQITICHIPPANPANVQTITIPAGQWPSHQAHGDIQGPCSNATVSLCFQGSTIAVSQSAVPALLNLGATQGPCSEPKISICHIPPGNPAAASTITIPQSQWPSHQQHGDVQGPCSTTMVSICYNGQQLSVSQTVWPVYQSLGATQGPCPQQTVTICHIPPGNPAAVQTLTIPQSAWPSHQAHGDVQGPCSSTMVTICYQGQTLSISQSAWSVYQGLGATQGACPPRQITICHIPPGNPTAAATITIPETDWLSHSSHGDIQGPCSNQQVTLCYQGNTVQVSASAVNALLNLGATEGPCPPRQITICHIPPDNPANAVTLTIPETQWASHQSHGDVQGACSTNQITICYQNQTMVISESAWAWFQSHGATRGPCPVRNIEICHIPPGNPSNAQTITIPESAWPAHQSHGDTRGACNMQLMTICFRVNDSRTSSTMQIPTAAWPYYQSQGATQGPCPVQTITICHFPPGNPAGAQTLTIPQTEWPAHQGHGDTQGACDMTTITICVDGNERQIPQAAWPFFQQMGATQGPCPVQNITICHFPPGNPGNPQTLTIPQTAWAAHQAHGDTQGACNMTPMTICADGTTMQIPTASWPQYQHNGATQGPCPVQNITICHIPPGDPDRPQTMTIPLSQWPTHQAHGDTREACNMTPMTICYQGRNMDIPTASWPYFQGQGATQGDCPEEQITICHIPPGNPNNPQTLTIARSAWPAHEAHGDVQGACNMALITICLDGRQMQVPTSSWNYYQGQGAGQGPCEQNITICHFPPGNPNNPQTLTIPQSAWAAHQAHGDTQGACNMSPMTICVDGNSMSVPTASWPYYQQMGATQGPCPEPQITICHIPPEDPSHPVTMQIPQNNWPGHQGHGDTQGACNMSPMTICVDGNQMSVPTASWPHYQQMGATQGACPQPQITICHIPPEDPSHPVTMQIPQNNWSGHQGHGDTQGACNMSPMTICVDGNQMSVPTASWPHYQQMGATQGACPQPQITICHIPPGNPGNPQTIQIPQNAWSSHQSHGDTQGECNMRPAEICLDGQTMTVPTASLLVYQQMGATTGACQERQITICHFPPGQPGNPQTLSIAQSAWPAHQSQHGDTQGACNMTPKTICADGTTMSIPTASWPKYQAMGATEGPCAGNNGQLKGNTGDPKGGGSGGQVKPNGGQVKPGAPAVKPGEVKPDSGKGNTGGGSEGKSTNGGGSEGKTTNTGGSNGKPAAPQIRPSGGGQ